MTDYISREAVLEFVEPDARPFLAERIKSIPAADVVERASGIVGVIPSAEVRPVRRGKWKPRDLTWGRSYYYCSACEETVDMPTAMGIPMFRYCPNCGADMRPPKEEK